MFAIDSTECWRYMDACQFQLKATVVFLNYVKSFAALGSCKLKGIVEDDAEKPIYISMTKMLLICVCKINIQTFAKVHVRCTCHGLVSHIWSNYISMI